MKQNRKVAAVVMTAVAITGSATALANASGAKVRTAIKTTKVTTSTRTFNVNDMVDMHQMHGFGGPMGMDGKGGFKNSGKDAVITATLGIDATTLHTRLAAGESLATIAGAKKDALIAALVAEMTKQFDAVVAAGKLTAAQATTLKAGLTAHVTEEVNETGHMGGFGGRGRGHGGRGGHGDMDGHGPMGMPKGATNGIPQTSGTNN